MKNIIVILLGMASISATAFASTDICQKEAEKFAIKDSGRGSSLMQDTEKNSNGTYEVYTAKDEIDTDYRIKTKISADGKTCIVVGHRIIDQQSG